MSDDVNIQDDNDRIHKMLADRLQHYEVQQERHSRQIYDKMDRLSGLVQESVRLQREHVVQFEKHQAVEDMWKQSHDSFHENTILPRLKSLEESRQFVANKIIGFVLVGVLASSCFAYLILLLMGS